MSVNLNVHNVIRVRTKAPQHHRCTDGRVFYCSEIVIEDKDGKVISLELFSDHAHCLEVAELV